MTATRILQSLATLDPGGAEAIVMNLYRKINRNKFQFDFLVNDRIEPYVFEEEVKSLGGKIYTIPKFNGRNVMLYRRKVDQILENHPVWKIMHIHNTSSAMLFIDIAKKHQLTTIAHAHFDHNTQDFRSYVQMMLRLPLKNTADYLLACSKLAGAYFFRIKEDEVHVLNNAIDVEDYIFDEQIRRRKREELDIQNDTVLGHVGRMDEQKKHAYLLDVFRAYHQLNPKSVLLLIGHGELKEMLEKKAREYGLEEEVKFLGIRSDVNELLQAMDIFIFPSIYEGLPVTLVEAQAAGLPIIASANITKEVVLTDLIFFKSIDIEPYRWAKAIDDKLLLFRNDMSKALIKAGYDVKETAKELQAYYQMIIEDGD